MNEIWEQAILPYNLPLTIVLGLIILFWVLAMFGTMDMDSLDVDIEVDADADLDTDVSPGGGGFLTSILKFVNATDVPLMMVLSFLSLFMWVTALLSNAALNPNQSWAVAMALLVGNFIVSCVFVKIITQPFKRFFRAFKKGENDDEPVIGRVGIVKSRVIDSKYGQVEIPRVNGAPAIVNCAMADGQPSLVRGNEVLVFDRDKERNLFIVRSADLTDRESQPTTQNKLTNETNTNPTTIHE